MHVDPLLALTGLGVGFVVGLTGMGGGALMTPILVLFFGIQPLAAVSSDLVAAVVMKPVGSAVHLRHGTVHLRLVKWLMVGSVPSAFAGVLLLRAIGGSGLQSVVRVALGVALLSASALMVVKALLGIRRGRRERRDGSFAQSVGGAAPLRIRPAATIAIGALGGLVVGMTSVGSGSLVIVLLLLLYPTLQANHLVGTDLVQAIPLVCSAAIGHLLFGDFQLGLTSSLLIGSVPGVYLGARVSAQAPVRVVRRALMLVLLASGLKLVGASMPVLMALMLMSLALAPLAWTRLRLALGLPRTPPAARPASGIRLQQPQT
jgi:uncharacterized protein